MKRHLLLIVPIVLLALLLPIFLSEFGIYLATEIFIMAIFAMSLGLIMGYAGLVSLGHAAFFAIGAYTVALIGPYLSNVYLIILAAIVISGVIALLTGAIFIRTSHFYFLMITFAFGQLVFVLLWQLRQWTGGADGVAVRIPMDLGFGVIYSSTGFYYIMCIASIIVYILLRMFVNSPAGKIIKGIMENESRMNAMGFNTRFYKNLTYTIAGATGGLAGSLYAFYNAFISPDMSHWMQSGIALLMVIIGGVGTLFGPVVGAGVFVLLQNFISSYTQWWHLIMGVVLVILVLVGRGGIVHWCNWFGEFVFQQLNKTKAKHSETESRDKKGGVK